MEANKVRPDSRAALMVKAMLDRCEAPRMPSLNTDSRAFATPDPVRWSEEFDLARYIRRGMGVVDGPSLVYAAHAFWEMDARCHDAYEVQGYIALLGHRSEWLQRTIYSDGAVVLFGPSEARGRWMLATDGAHDFPPECPPSWRLADGTSAGEPPPGKRPAV